METYEGQYVMKNKLSNSVYVPDEHILNSETSVFEELVDLSEERGLALEHKLASARMDSIAQRLDVTGSGLIRLKNGLIIVNETQFP
jgi:hypothetical protein